MSRISIVVLQPLQTRQRFLPEAELSRLNGLAQLVHNPHEAALLSAQERRELLATAQVVVTGWGGSGLEEADYACAPHLKLVGLIGSSIKNLSPQAAWQRGVTVTNTARAIGKSVAEFSVGLMLNWLHGFGAYDQALKSGSAWPQAQARHLQQDLSDMVVGLIGCGAVGAEVARLLKAFGAQVVVYDPFANPTVLAESGLEATKDLADLLRRCDILSLHAGLTPATHHLIGAAELATLRPGTLLVNTSRGGLVDPAALKQALQEGHIAAALDVFDPEPLDPADALRSLENVLLTPHVAGFHNRSVYRRCARMLVDDILLFLAGQPPRNTVTPQMFQLMT